MTAIESYVYATVVDNPRLPVTLRFDERDPFAVWLLFPPRDPGEDAWPVDRGLVAAGLDGPSGVGNVTVAPLFGGRVAVTLRSPGDGPVAVLFNRMDLFAFLRRTFRLVPPGAERLDVDAELAALLSGGAS